MDETLLAKTINFLSWWVCFKFYSQIAAFESVTFQLNANSVIPYFANRDLHEPIAYRAIRRRKRPFVVFCTDLMPLYVLVSGVYKQVDDL